MRKNHWVALPVLGALLPLGLQSCADRVGFGVVSIRPIYGWADGCTPVSVEGHGFGDDVAVTVGGLALENAAIPDENTENPAANERGFVVTGTTPAADAAALAAAVAGGLPGVYAGVVVTSGGDTSEISIEEREDGLDGDFFYQACPYDAYPEYLSVSEGLAAGTEVAISGCNLQDGYKVKFGVDADGDGLVETTGTADMTTVCKTAEKTFVAPNMPDGTYYLAIVDSADVVVFPAADSGCDPFGAVGAQIGGSDTATYDMCDGVPTVTYGTGGGK